MMWHEEHFWDVSILQSVHLSNLIRNSAAICLACSSHVNMYISTLPYIAELYVAFVI